METIKLVSLLFLALVALSAVYIVMADKKAEEERNVNPVSEFRFNDNRNTGDNKNVENTDNTENDNEFKIFN